MSVPPVGPRVLPGLPFLPDDCLVLVFKDLFFCSEKYISTLALTCKDWMWIVNHSNIGRIVFEIACLPFPNNLQNNTWQHAYRLAIGNFFVNDQKQNSTIITIPYSNQLKVNKEIAWIGDRGFVHYGDAQFSVCLFTSPHQVANCLTTDSISKLAVFQDQIVCALTNGTINVYSLDPLTLTFYYKAHAKPVLHLLECKNGWFSISRSEIVQFDLLSKNKDSKDCLKICESETLWFAAEDVHLFNNDFLFYFNKTDLQKAGYHALDILKKQLIPVEVPTILSSDIYLWGNRIALHDDDLTFTSFRANSTHQYVDPMVGETISLNFSNVNTYDEHEYFFRGDVVFKISFSHNFQDIEDTKDPVHLDSISLLNLKDGEEIFNYTDENGIVLDEDGRYMCNIFNNKFLYIRDQCNEIVVIDFPIVDTSSCHEPSFKKRKLEPKNEDLKEIT